MLLIKLMRFSAFQFPLCSCYEYEVVLVLRLSPHLFCSLPQTYCERIRNAFFFLDCAAAWRPLTWHEPQARNADTMSGLAQLENGFVTPLIPLLALSIRTRPLVRSLGRSDRVESTGRWRGSFPRLWRILVSHRCCCGGVWCVVLGAALLYSNKILPVQQQQ